MIDHLRALLNRPIADADRPRLFVAAATIILVAALVLALTSGGRDDPRGKTAQPTASEPRAPAPPPVDEPTDSAALPVPSEEGEREEGAEPSRAQLAAAKRSARRFLDGYLAYTYGRADPRGIEAATAELRRALAADRPRVPATERRRRAEVETLQVDGANARRAGVLALVDDGRRRYSVRVQLARHGSEWRVTGVGG